MGGVLGWYASAGCRGEGEEVGRLNASCVLDMVVRVLRVVLPEEKRLVNQLIAGRASAGGARCG